MHHRMDESIRITVGNDKYRDRGGGNWNRVHDERRDNFHDPSRQSYEYGRGRYHGRGRGFPGWRGNPDHYRYDRNFPERNGGKQPYAARQRHSDSRNTERDGYHPHNRDFSPEGKLNERINYSYENEPKGRERHDNFVSEHKRDSPEERHWSPQTRRPSPHDRHTGPNERQVSPLNRTHSPQYNRSSPQQRRLGSHEICHTSFESRSRQRGSKEKMSPISPNQSQRRSRRSSRSSSSSSGSSTSSSSRSGERKMKQNPGSSVTSALTSRMKQLVDSLAPPDTNSKPGGSSLFDKSAKSEKLNENPIFGSSSLFGTVSGLFGKTQGLPGLDLENDKDETKKSIPPVLDHLKDVEDEEAFLYGDETSQSQDKDFSEPRKHQQSNDERKHANKDIEFHRSVEREEKILEQNINPMKRVEQTVTRSIEFDSTRSENLTKDIETMIPQAVPTQGFSNLFGTAVQRNARQPLAIHSYKDQLPISKKSPPIQGISKDKTIENILKSIGFNFELSKVMQEKAEKSRTTKDDEGEIMDAFGIKEGSSFLRGGLTNVDLGTVFDTKESSKLPEKNQTSDAMHNQLRPTESTQSYEERARKYLEEQKKSSISKPVPPDERIQVTRASQKFSLVGDYGTYQSEHSNSASAWINEQPTEYEPTDTFDYNDPYNYEMRQFHIAENTAQSNRNTAVKQLTAATSSPLEHRPLANISKVEDETITQHLPNLLSDEERRHLLQNIQERQKRLLALETEFDHLKHQQIELMKMKCGVPSNDSKFIENTKLLEAIASQINKLKTAADNDTKKIHMDNSVREKEACLRKRKDKENLYEKQEKIARYESGLSVKSQTVKEIPLEMPGLFQQPIVREKDYFKDDDKTFVRSSSKPKDDVARFLEATISKSKEDDERFARSRSRPREDEERLVRSRSRPRDDEERFARSRSRPRDDEERFARSRSRPRDDDERFARSRSRPKDDDERFVRSRSRPRDDDERFVRSRSRPRDDDEKFARSRSRPRDDEERFARSRSRPRDDDEKFKRSRSSPRDDDERLVRSSSRQRDDEIGFVRSKSYREKDGFERSKKKPKEEEKVIKSKSRPREEQSAEKYGSRAEGPKNGTVHSEKSRKLQEDQNVDRQKEEIKKFQVSFNYFDAGNHWCRYCDVTSASVTDHFQHLHTKKHRKRADNYLKPWANESSTKHEPGSKFVLVPLKGVEFSLPCQAIFCNLCKVFSGDEVCAKSHLLSEAHNEKYRRYIEEHPSYEKSLLLDKTATVNIKKKLKEKSHESKKKHGKKKKSESKKSGSSSSSTSSSECSDSESRNSTHKNLQKKATENKRTEDTKQIKQIKKEDASVVKRQISKNTKQSDEVKAPSVSSSGESKERPLFKFSMFSKPTTATAPAGGSKINIKLSQFQENINEPAKKEENVMKAPVKPQVIIRQPRWQKKELERKERNQQQNESKPSRFDQKNPVQTSQKDPKEKLEKIRQLKKMAETTDFIPLPAMPASKSTDKTPGKRNTPGSIIASASKVSTLYGDGETEEELKMLGMSPQDVIVSKSSLQSFNKRSYDRSSIRNRDNQQDTGSAPFSKWKTTTMHEVQVTANQAVTLDDIAKREEAIRLGQADMEIEECDFQVLDEYVEDQNN